MTIEDKLAMTLRSASENEGFQGLTVEELGTTITPGALTRHEWEELIRRALVGAPRVFEHVEGGRYRAVAQDVYDDDIPPTGGYVAARRRDFGRLEAASLSSEDEARIEARVRENFEGRDLAALLARDALCLLNELRRERARRRRDR